MPLAKIEVIDEPEERKGIPWENAPPGPACVLDTGYSALVNAGDVVMITQVEGLSQPRILRASGEVPFKAINPSSSVRVKPLGDCTLKLAFTK